jgi:hypothetical protein
MKTKNEIEPVEVFVSSVDHDQAGIVISEYKSNMKRD